MGKPFLGKMEPREFVSLATAWRKSADEAREPSLKNESPPAMAAMKGGAGFNDNPQGANPANRDIGVNFVYAAYKAVVPKVLGRLPRPATRARWPGGELLADCVNALAEYRDIEGCAREQNEAVYQDAFLRGIGYMRHDRDATRGIARSMRFDPRSVWWDTSANSTRAAKWVIERHTLSRAAFAKRFGQAAADRAAAKQLEKSGGRRASAMVGEALKTRQGKSLLDTIEYFLLFSKVDGENRFYAYCEEFGDEGGDLWLNKSKRDGKPGEGFGEMFDPDAEDWPFDEDDWHLTPMTLTKLNSAIEGLSWPEPVWGEIQAYQRLAGVMIKANEDAGRQIYAFPMSLREEMQKIVGSRDPIGFLGLDDNLFSDRKIGDIVKLVSEFRPSPTLNDAFALAKSLAEANSGYNAVAQLESQGVETAAEATTLSASANNRVAHDRERIEFFLTTVEQKEAAIDLATMPRNSVVRVTPLDGGAYDVPDVPYPDAVLLERKLKPKDVASYQAAKQAEQQRTLNASIAGNVIGAPAQPPPPVEPTPEIAARERHGVPLEAEAEIIEPGIEAFVGPEKANGWIEGMTLRQVKHELSIAIERGSTDAAAGTQRFNNLVVLGKTMMPIWQSLNQWDRVQAFNDALARSLDDSAAETLLGKPGEFMQAFQAMQQQQAEQAAAQAQAEQPQQAPPLDPNKQLDLQGKQMDIQKIEAQRQASREKEEFRVRERSMIPMGGAA